MYVASSSSQTGVNTCQLLNDLDALEDEAQSTNLLLVDAQQQLVLLCHYFPSTQAIIQCIHLLKSVLFHLEWLLA